LADGEVTRQDPQPRSGDGDWWSQILGKLVQHENLSVEEAKNSARKIFACLEERGSEIPTVLASYFGCLTMKGPTVDELAGMCSAMEDTMTHRFNFDIKGPVVTAGGTGGDTIKTINVTTPATIISAAAGAIAVKSVAKAFSSKTGSEDLARSMGINVDAQPDVVKKCVERIGTTIWASANNYPWMEPLIQCRNLPTAPLIFPLLSSLRLMIATSLNPFSVKRQVRGTALPNTELIAKVLLKIGYEKALVPIGYGSNETIRIDEFSNLGKTKISELRNGKIEVYEITSEDLGIERAAPREVKAYNTHEQNARAALQVISGRDRSPRRDLILLNAGAILYLADCASDFKDGYETVCKAVDEGKAVEKVKQLVVESGGDARRLDSLVRC